MGEDRRNTCCKRDFCDKRPVLEEYELLKNFIKDNMVKKLNAVELPAGKPYKHPLLYEMSQRASKEGKEYFYIDKDSRIPVEVNNPTATYYCQSKTIPDEILKILNEEQI